MTLEVTFWGTRGSRPTSGGQPGTTQRVGGNTSCASVRTPTGDLIILDAGTGLAGLGSAIGNDRLKALVLITHTHWDHIQGLPFLDPIYLAQNSVDIRGPHSAQGSLADSLRTQMSPNFFPVSFDSCEAITDVSDITDPHAFEWGGVRITPHLMNHTAPTLGYRLDVDGASLAYATDAELRPLLDEADASGSDSRFAELVRWAAHADLLLHDTQYTDEEYESKRGWGHSSVSDVLRLKREAGIASLGLWHHDPAHTDEILLDIVAECAAGDSGVFAASQGDSLNVVDRSPVG